MGLNCFSDLENNSSKKQKQWALQPLSQHNKCPIKEVSGRRA
uniref:Uncharacterized protein n=1 Tax=Arundo donax TaxID=35708 RepID=A0A0A9BE43_ARUDO